MRILIPIIGGVGSSILANSLGFDITTGAYWAISAPIIILTGLVCGLI